MSDLPINPADLTVVIVIVLSGLFAMARGFVREVLSLASWVGAALVTLWGFDLALVYTRRLVETPWMAYTVTGIALFVCSLILFSMIGGGIASLIRGTHLNALDRTLGFLFGLVRGALIVAVLWLGLGWAIPPQDQPPWLREARVLPAVERLADFLRSLAPPEFRGRVQSAGDAAERARREAQQYQAILQAPGLPQAKSPAAPGETSYKTDERRGLDGLFQRTQTPEPASTTR
ncbi:MAG: CvpA family protein [Alphaproteobacteria bacterium]|nr:CvpA family protein [Alphaproteobacteria bacterium]